MEKQPESFHEHARCIGGRVSTCRECSALQKKAYRAAHREEVNAQQRKSHAAHRESARARQREYYAANREAILEKNRRWVEANRDSVMDYRRAWRQRNAGHILEKVRQWALDNPEHVRAIQSRASARRRSRFANVERELVRINVVAKRDRDICHICGKVVKPSDRSIDHLIPIVDGGPHLYSNVALAHRRCNSRRGRGRGPTQLRILG